MLLKYEHMLLGCRNVFTVCTNVEIQLRVREYVIQQPSPRLCLGRPLPAVSDFVYWYRKKTKQKKALLEPVKDGTFMNPHWDQV